MELFNLADNGSVVKLKGLPFKATVEDVAKFFTGFVLAPECTFFKRHPDGRPNGEAFVVFDSPEEARKSTQKDRETFGEKFGDRYVRVYPVLESDLADMQAAVLQQTMSVHQGSGHTDSVVKIKSLPFDATQLDIIQFFESFRLKPNGVQLVVRSDNKPTGEAFVDFESSDEAARSIRERDHKVFSEKFGDRYVRLIQVSRKEMQATLALRFGGEGILKMKGIPFKAAASDVRKFFHSYRIKADGISFIMHADGRPTGMAFIEFETPQDAVRAMEKDRAKFGPEYGDRFCMLQLVGRHEMDKVTLMKESDSSASKLLSNINALQAAALQQAASQAALNNTSQMSNQMSNQMNNQMNNQMLMNNHWLSQLHMGLMNSGLINQNNGLNSLAQLQSTGPMLEAMLSQQLQLNNNSLGLLQGQQLAQMPPSTAAADSVPTSSWMLGGQDSGAAANNLFYYQQQQQQQPQADWTRSAAEHRDLSSAGWPDQYSSLRARNQLAGPAVAM